MKKLKRGNALAIWNISAEILKARGEKIIHRLNVVLPAVWQSSSIPLDLKRFVALICKEKRYRQHWNNYRGILLSMPAEVLAHLLMIFSSYLLFL